MGTDISGIRAMFQAGASVKAGMPGREEKQDLKVSFMDLMSQSGLGNMNISVKSSQMEIGADDSNFPDTAFDSSLSSAKNISIKGDKAPEEAYAEAAKPLEEFEEEIREALKEELGVTDEEITAAMESLGLSFLDLRNLSDLASLVQNLTGEEIATLFLSDAFQAVMEQVTVSVDALCEELGITKEEFDLLCETWDQMQSGDVSDEQLPPQDLETSEMGADASEAGSEDKPVLTQDQKPENLKELGALQKNDEAQQKEQTSSVKETQETSEKTLTGVTAEESGDLSGEDAESHQQMNHSGEMKQDAAHVTFGTQQSVRTEEFVLPQDAAAPYSSSVDVADLIQQIARNVRVTISQTVTSMEMQLNPEHLGKLYLNVSEREGVIRAQITAQNEAVKEALETQLVELRQSLNQQGVKVDAIEVMVGTHEFEQNLEENARQEQQMQQQMEDSKGQTRRNLNLNDLDGLSGLMTEEEELAAKIMRQNGNQVDLTA